MPYNTRRKSLSLPSLGIHLPTAKAHRSPPTAKPASPPTEQQSPPSKRVKRSHESSLSPPPDVKFAATVETIDARPKSRRETYEHTPPPSPGDSGLLTKIDTEGINDDIVIAVIEQLEKTGNRPHLIKELASVLSTTSDTVAKYGYPKTLARPQKTDLAPFNSSANPAALLSSRLSLYLKRPWTALAPCPLAKELIPIHPRKVFFYLTTSPHQELPENSDDIISPASQKRMTPSVSTPSIDQDEDENDLRERERLSPSPEIDLSSPELDGDGSADRSDDPPTPAGSLSARSSLARDGTAPHHEIRLAHLHRAASPPLEGDEREFTQTATAVRERGMSLDGSVRPTTETEVYEQSDTIEPAEETAEMTHRRNQETAAALFGHSHDGLNVAHQQHPISSPMIQAKHMHIEVKRDNVFMGLDVEMADADMTSWELRSPENVELDELDDLFGGY